MPRKTRLIVPGAVYHVMARCLDHLQLFLCDEDRAFFVMLLEKYLTRTATKCYAWVLMDNHYHLVLRLGGEELWQIMKPLNMRYAQYYQKRYKRRGPLFMDRYKSIVTQDQNYIQELVRYVHLNPVRAGICSSIQDLAQFRWSGHCALITRYEASFQDVATVLFRFGLTIEDARVSYIKFLEDGLSDKRDQDVLVDLVRNSNKGSESGRKPGCWVIGDVAFVNDAVASDQARRLRISRFEQLGGSLDPIARSICDIFGITEHLLAKRHRGGVGSDARKVFAYAAGLVYGAPVKEVAQYLNVGSAAVSAMIQAGERIVEERKLKID